MLITIMWLASCGISFKLSKSKAYMSEKRKKRGRGHEKTDFGDTL